MKFCWFTQFHRSIIRLISLSQFCEFQRVSGPFWTCRSIFVVHYQRKHCVQYYSKFNKRILFFLKYYLSGHSRRLFLPVFFDRRLGCIPFYIIELASTFLEYLPVQRSILDFLLKLNILMGYVGQAFILGY